MKKCSVLLVVAFFALTASAFAQNGGKAEPKRVKFAKGKAMTRLSATLSGDQEQEYVFGARKGQKVYITNFNSDRFSYRVFNDEVNYESTELGEPTLEFIVPATGDYMLFVKKASASPRTAKFSVTLAIR